MSDPVEAIRLFAQGIERKGLSPYTRSLHIPYLILSHASTGDLAKAKALGGDHPYFPTVAALEGDWEARKEWHLGNVERTRVSEYRLSEIESLAVLSDTSYLTGDLEQASEYLRQALSLYDPADVYWDIRLRPAAVLLAVAADRLDEAAEHMEVCRAIIAQGEDWMGRVGWVERAEGVLAGAQGSDFTPHFEKSVEILQRYRMPWEQAETSYYWGRTLNAAHQYSDANDKFAAAIEIYRRYGAGERWIDRVEQARTRPQSSRIAANSQTTSSASADENIFRKDGDFWTVTHQGKTFRLRDSKGLEYIAHLLANPGVRIHACDLVAVIEGGDAGSPGALPERARAEGLEASQDLGDAGDALDSQAISAYRRRLTEVREELAEAERNNDSGAVERARHEYEILTAQLSAGVGRGGRIRRSSSHVERARTLVTKNIRAGVERIRRNDGKLGEHFATSIHTGAFCFYLPDHETKPSWQM